MRRFPSSTLLPLLPILPLLTPTSTSSSPSSSFGVVEKRGLRGKVPKAVQRGADGLLRLSCGTNRGVDGCGVVVDESGLVVCSARFVLTALCQTTSNITPPSEPLGIWSGSKDVVVAETSNGTLHTCGIVGIDLSSDIAILKLLPTPPSFTSTLSTILQYIERSLGFGISSRPTLSNPTTPQTSPNPTSRSSPPRTTKSSHFSHIPLWEGVECGCGSGKEGVEGGVCGCELPSVGWECWLGYGSGSGEVGGGDKCVWSSVVWLEGVGKAGEVGVEEGWVHLDKVAKGESLFRAGVGSSFGNWTPPTQGLGLDTLAALARVVGKKSGEEEKSPPPSPSTQPPITPTPTTPSPTPSSARDELCVGGAWVMGKVSGKEGGSGGKRGYGGLCCDFTRPGLLPCLLPPASIPILSHYHAANPTAFLPGGTIIPTTPTSLSQTSPTPDSTSSSSPHSIFSLFNATLALRSDDAMHVNTPLLLGRPAGVVGRSGAAVMDVEGRLLGMVVRGGREVRHIIPSKSIKNFISALHHSPTPQNPSQPTCGILTMRPVAKGIQILEVLPHSPAFDAGIKAGDILTHTSLHPDLPPHLLPIRDLRILEANPNPKHTISITSKSGESKTIKLWDQKGERG